MATVKTIEEKARAYDEAIERAIDFMNGEVHYALEKGESIMCWIFPELKESEDERIIGDIIATIHLYYGEPLEDEAKEMIAWVKKQGKNDMGISEATKKKLEDNLNKALEKETPESWDEFLEKQVEQKPNNKVELATKSYITPNSKFFQWIYDRLIYVHHENPDVDYMRSLKERIEDMQKAADTEKGAKGNEREIPNSAWSEEDELYIRELESLVKQVWATAEHKNDKDTIHKMSDLSFFLKTLKPQNTWKPSDEQMEALDSAIHCYA